MAGQAKLTIVVALKDSFTKGMAQVSRFLVGENGKIGAAFSRVTKSVFNLRNAIVGGLAAVMTKQLVSAYAQQEAAEQRLANAMKLTGTFTEAAEARMHAFASKLQETSVVGDEVALRMLGIATAMGQSEERARKMVQAAADLSAATGKDLNASFQQLLKSTGGMAGELAEVLPEVKALTAEQLKMGGATDIIAKKFAGFAAAEAKTFGGQLTQIGNLWSDVKEKFGSFVAAIFQSGLGEWIKTTLVVLNEELQEVSKAFKGSDAAKAWSDTMVVVLKAAAKGVAEVADGFRLMMKPIDIFVRANTATELFDLEHALVTMNQALVDSTTHGNRLIDVSSGLSAGTHDLANAMLAQHQGTTMTRDAFADLINRLQKVAEQNREYVDGTNEGISVAEQMAKAQDVIDKAFAKVDARYEADKKAKEDAARATEDLARQQAMLNAALAIGAATDPLAGLDAAAVTDAAKSYQALGEAIADYEATVKGFNADPPEFAAVSAADSGMTTMGPTDAAIDKALASWQDYFDSIDTMSVAWAHAMQNTISQVAGGVANIVGDAVGDILRGEIRTTKELGKALQEMFTDLAISIVQDLIKISIQMAIMAGIKAVAGGAGGAVGGAGAGSFARGGVLRGGVEEWWPGERAATGGVFQGPTPILLGDNPSRVEAAVPMPDGKRIPVDVRGPVGGGGITLNLNVQAMDGPSVVGTLSRPEAQQAITAAIVAAQRKNSKFRSVMKTR